MAASGTQSSKLSVRLVQVGNNPKGAKMSSHSDSFVASGNSPTQSASKTPPDFIVENHGSIFLFRMNTPAAVEWISQNVQSDAQFFGDALAVEHRYARDLAVGMQANGLVLA